MTLPLDEGQQILALLNWSKLGDTYGKKPEHENERSHKFCQANHVRICVKDVKYHHSKTSLQLGGSRLKQQPYVGAGRAMRRTCSIAPRLEHKVYKNAVYQNIRRQIFR